MLPGEAYELAVILSARGRSWFGLRPARRLEGDILSDPSTAVLYARNVLKGRWPEAEAVILAEGGRAAMPAVVYARDVIRGCWPEAEPLIAHNPRAAFIYASTLLPSIVMDDGGGRPYFKEFEDRMGFVAGLKLPSLSWIPDWEYVFEYAETLGRSRSPKIMSLVAGSPYHAYMYAFRVLKGRFREAEAGICQSPWAYNYAVDVVKGRWPEGERAIMRDSMQTAYYAAHIIGGRWPEGEPHIKVSRRAWKRYETEMGLLLSRQIGK